MIDLVRYDDPSIVFDLATYGRQATPQKEPQTQVERFTLENETISSQTLLQASVEFPRINSAFDGRPYRYLYLTDLEGSTLYQLDTQTREKKCWSEPGSHPGEPIFVSSPNSTSENEGLLLAVLHGHPSSLLILDAQTFSPIARAAVPQTIPPGLHGNFF